MERVALGDVVERVSWRKNEKGEGRGLFGWRGGGGVSLSVGGLGSREGGREGEDGGAGRLGCGGCVLR